jgi:hypothetical protein
MACDAKTLLAQAAANGYYNLDSRNLKIALLQLLCDGGGGGGGGGVTSLNGLTAAVLLAAGANITITPAGNTLTIAASSGSGLSGAGSPEGVQVGSPGQTYFDTTAKGFWVKDTGVGNTGWLQLIA